MTTVAELTQRLTKDIVREHYERGNYIPEDGHAYPAVSGRGRVQTICFVGALSWASTNGFDPDHQSPEAYVAQKYDLTKDQVGLLEQGFDYAFTTRREEEFKDRYDPALYDWVTFGYDIGNAMRAWRREKSREGYWKE